MQKSVVVFGLLFLGSTPGLSQTIVSEEPMLVENGKLRCRTIIVGFNQNVIPTPPGVTVVDTARHPIRNEGVKTLLRQLSLRYGHVTIRKSIPRAVWGDTLARNKRTGRLTRVSDQSQSFRLTFAQRLDVDSVLSLFRSIPVVKHAEQPVTVGLLSTNDPLFGLQYNLQRISAEQAWQVTTGQPSVRLAIIDIYGQGALNDHPDLTGRFAPGFGTGGAAQHAFLVTGVAGAATNNNIGIASLAHNVSLIDYHLNVYGQSDTYLAGLINEAANPALGNADVINFSFLTLKYKLTPSGDLRWCPHDFDNVSIAIDNAIGQGVVCVAAVGNQTSLYPGCELTIPFQAYPAGYAGVIAVSASDFDDNFYDPFNYWETSVAAPGVGIWTTNPAAEGGYSSEDGTSFSSPQVAGLAALILSVNPSLSAETVREYICRTADKVGQYPYDQNLAFGTYNNRMGYGRINAYKALSLANGDPRVPQSFSASVHYTQYNAHPKISWVRAPLHPQDVDVEQYEIWRRVISNPNPYLNPPWSLLTTIGNTPTDYIDFSIQWAGSGPNTARYRIKAVDAAGLKSPFTDSVGVNFGNAFKLIIEGRETPSELTLEQNYPNPFNPSTTIDFVIPSDGRVSLKVFNVLGQEVNTLIDENKSQGRHSMKLDATGLPSGLYFYRLQHNGNTLNGKMLLAK